MSRPNRAHVTRRQRRWHKAAAEQRRTCISVDEARSLHAAWIEMFPECVMLYGGARGGLSPQRLLRGAPCGVTPALLTRPPFVR